MGKYLIAWEIDQSKVAINPQERGAAWGAFMAMIKQDIKKGTIKDWGAYVGELNGYTIAEGTEAEIGKLNQQYVPFVIFKVHPVASVAQVEEVVKSLSK
jgi:hypothetical protein